VLVCRHVELLDRLGDCRLLVGRIHDPHQLGRRPLEVVDGPGMGLPFLVGRLGMAQSSPTGPTAASVRRTVRGRPAGL
jgi:hypothetical protein